MNGSVFAFDRDYTVDVNQGPVPLEAVERLAEEHEVWAIGNQRLKEEAGISGIREMLTRLKAEGDPKALLRAPSRRERLRILRRLFPDAEAYVVVDDVDLSDVEDWRYYSPEEFVEEFLGRRT